MLFDKDTPTPSNIPASEFNEQMKANFLDIASTIKANGGPRNHWEEAIVDLANVTGNTLQEIEIATDAKRSKLITLP